MDRYSIMAAKTGRITEYSAVRAATCRRNHLHEASGRHQFTNPADADRLCSVLLRRANTGQIEYLGVHAQKQVGLEAFRT